MNLESLHSLPFLWLEGPITKQLQVLFFLISEYIFTFVTRKRSLSKLIHTRKVLSNYLVKEKFSQSNFWTILYLKSESQLSLRGLNLWISLSICFLCLFSPTVQMSYSATILPSPSLLPPIYVQTHIKRVSVMYVCTYICTCVCACIHIHTPRHRRPIKSKNK